MPTYSAPILTPKRLGNILRAARKYWLLTVPACAALIGVKPTRLAQWEAGRSTPPPELLQVAVLVLRVDPALFLNPRKSRGLDRDNRYTSRTCDEFALTCKFKTVTRGSDEQKRFDAFCRTVAIATDATLATAEIARK